MKSATPNKRDTIDGASFDPPSAFTNIPSDLVLDFANNNLVFEFQNVSQVSPQSNHYRYRVKEVNERWSRTTTLNLAEFTNLPPGKLTFEVEYLGHGFEWSEPLQYKFEVLPPWYRTLYAYFGYVLMLVGIVWLYARWQNNKLNAENIRLESMVSKRTLDLKNEKEKSDNLLLNILPSNIAEELKTTGKADARSFDNVTIVFSDFMGFTELAEELSPHSLVDLLNQCFKSFDEIMVKHDIEKIKTIGDAYMSAGGLTGNLGNSVKDSVLAALEMQDYVEEIFKTKNTNEKASFRMRVGVHTGHVVAGIVGLKKFQYDLWGDAVNIASRMENKGEAGRVNISRATYDRIKDFPEFSFESRGLIKVKGKGELEMWFVGRND